MAEDAWGALQADGVEATDGVAPGTMIAFTDVGAYGDHIVGFQVGLTLPAKCFKCAAEPVTSRLSLKVVTQRDLLWRLAAASSGNKDWLRARSKERMTLQLPYCEGCLAKRTLATRVRIAALLSPLIIVGGTVAVAAVAKSAAAWALLALLLVAVGLAVGNLILRRKTRLSLLSIDEDGIIRISGVHHESAQAVEQVASGAG